MSTRSVTSAIEEAAATHDPVLADWIAEHGIEPQVARALDVTEQRVSQGAAPAGAKVVVKATKLPPRRVASLPEAVHAALGWARDLVDRTAFEPDGRMSPDQTGASVSTYGALVNYGAMADGAPIDVHMMGIEALRQHSRMQIDRGEWEAAYGAIKREYERVHGSGSAPPEEEIPRIFHPVSSAKSGLADGSRYIWDKGKRKASLRLPLRQKGPNANTLLSAAGLVKGRDFSWFRGEGESYASWIAVEPEKVLLAATALQGSYPELAKALLQNGPIWMEEAGVTPATAGAAPGAVVAGSGAVVAGSGASSIPPLPADRLEAGTSGEGVRWEWKAGDRSVAFLFPGYGTKQMLTGRVPFSWDVREEKSARLFFVRILLSELEKLADTVAPRYPQTAAQVRALAPQWVAAANEVADAMAGQVATVAVDVSTLDPERGTSPDRVEWRWDRDKYAVRFLFPQRGSKEMLNAGGVPFTWDVRRADDTPCVKGGDARGCLYWHAVPVTGLKALPTAILVHYPRTAAIVQALLPQWTAERASLKHTAEAGQMEEGSWKMMPNGFLRLRTMYKPEARGWDRKVTGAAVRMEKDLEGWYFEFKPSRASYVIMELRKHYPKLAEALSRALGGISLGVEDEEAEKLAKCAPLEDMSAAKRPEDVKHPLGRAVLDDVVRALKERLPYGLVPMPFQLVGIAFAKLTGYRALVGDVPGLGKTIQALGCIAVDPEQLLPAVVVCPASVLLNWNAEARKWLPTVPVHILGSTKSALPPAGWKGLILATWAMLPYHAQVLATWGVQLVVCDEFHYAKEPTAQRSKAAAHLAENVPHVLGLTGTPIKNRAIELHNLLRMLDAETWGTRAAFGRQFTNVETITTKDGKAITKYEGGKNLDELNRLLRCAMVRRLKEDVLTDLPAKTRTYLPMQLDPKARGDYERAADEFADWLADEMPKRIASEYEAAGIRPSEATREFRQEVEDRVARALQAEALVRLGYLRRIVGRAKIAFAIEQVESFVDAGESLVVFAEHKDVVQALERALEQAGVPFGTIDGSTSVADRKQIVDAFQAGQLRVFIGTQAAKEGITLTRASNTLFVERWWTPGDEEQAEDRIHRIGQRNAATIWFVHAENTIDDDMGKMIERKRAISVAAVGGTAIPASTEGASTSGGGGSGVGEVIRALAKRRKGESSPRANPASALAHNNGMGGVDAASPVPAGYGVQALLFTPDWSRARAVQWAKTHRFASGRVSSVPTKSGAHLQFEQHAPEVFVPGSFTTAALVEGVTAVIGKRRT